MNNSNRKYDLSCDIPKDIKNLDNSECIRSTPKSFEHSMKNLFGNLYQKNSLTELKSQAFRKLLIDGFDSEQIFEQIDLQNKSASGYFGEKIGGIVGTRYLLSNIDNEVQHSSDIDDDSTFNQNSDEEKQINFPHNKEDEFIFDDDSTSSLDMEYNEKIKTSPKKKKFQAQRSRYKSAVDDQFFKLSNLEEFLKMEDLRAENKLEDPEDEEEIDYFQDIPSDDNISESDSEYEEEEIAEKPKDIMYDDFFDAPDSGDESDNLKENMDSDIELNKMDIRDGESDVNDSESEIEEPELDENKICEDDVSNNLKEKISKTPFEIQQEKIKDTISSYEDVMLKKAEWHLTGEVFATSRPKDSLLHKETDFDVNAKPVIVEDAKLEEQTENAIKTIIKNKAFSDGQRTVKPVNDNTLRKEILLDQSKSKKSLAEVYEDEYLKKKYGEQKEENTKHVEIKKLMDSLLPELQALFSHIPKPAIPDIKIISNLPAITVEEVAPTSTSDVTLLAPEEVKRKTGLIKGQTERSDTDRKRERKKKKVMQRMKFKKSQSEDSSTVKSGKQAKIDELKKIKQHRNTKLADMGVEKIKSSKDFFDRLQETVNSKAQPFQLKKKKK